MLLTTIRLSFEDIKDFVRVAESIDSDVDIMFGRYICDAKSIVALYSFDLSKPLGICIHSDDIELLKKFDRWKIIN